MDTQMEYRQDTPEQHGFTSEQEEYVGMREQIQDIMEHSCPEDVIDMLLILANICDYRSLMSEPDGKTASWYTMTKYMLRNILSVADRIPSGPRPNFKLENQSLYWPDTEQTH
jgi:hypothetical protein